VKSEIVDFKMLPIAKLVPHPDAEAFPRDSEDQSAVNVSVSDQGILAPLHVLADEQPDGTRQVIDGVTRLLAARATERGAGSDQKLPCILVKTDDPASYVLHLNASRRRVTTGTRILAYITCHKAQVLAAFEALHNPKATGKAGGLAGGRGNEKAPSRDGAFSDDWSVEGIAARLGVSDKDVGLAIELLRCKELKLAPPVCVGGKDQTGRKLDFKVHTDVQLWNQVEGHYLEVMSGKKPVRKWKASISGSANTRERGKAATDYVALAIRTFTSIKTICLHWESLPIRDRATIQEQFELTVPHLPDEWREIASSFHEEQRKGKRHG